MEGWGSLRYILPALGGGLAVYFLIAGASKAPNNKSCYFGFGPLSILIGGTIMFSLLTINLYINNAPNDGFNDEAWLKPCFILLSMVFAVYSLDSWKRKIIWTDKGLSIQRFLRANVFIPWAEVKNLNYNDWSQWWKLSFENGKYVVFYDMMRGSKHLVSEISEKLK